ncbi:MAG: YegP family protein [Polaromonas sp.]|uniref:YegP family protein n=1 Tax=Polaromonas sp. TaxID=1869339 RepID=UPI00272F7A45|nr:YegP family protein [Polaromonas sp.]MDP2448020.1 YegP family protein [Polaromonas sp.]MDP3246748.1 YegP family protein [Polaromonas sp.]MDP3756377.1 YegP family protein [Polaromonas sp.]
MAVFELIQAGKGQFMFRLIASNSQIVLTSEIYATKKAAAMGIEAVRQNATRDKNFLRKRSLDNACYFVLVAKNGEIIARSEMYANAATMEHVISTIQNGSLAQSSVRDIGDLKMQTKKLLREVEKEVELEAVATHAAAPPIPKPLVMHLELGTAKAPDLAELFHELSVLYQMAGGSGLVFYHEASKERVGVLA